MTTDEQYVPDEEDVRTAYALEAARDTIGDTDYRAIPDARAEFDRFLARVRRDAAESTYAAAYRAGWLDGQNGSIPDPRMAYPEETP